MRFKMVRKLVVLAVMVLAVVLSTAGFAAEGVRYEAHADALKSLGLFSGTNNGFELDRAPKRVEVAAMLVKFLGAEAEANAMKYIHPFTDVPAWANNIVGYMYEKGLTTGIGNNMFGSSKTASAKDYSVFLLKALGYDMNDFEYANTMAFAVKFGLFSEADRADVEGRAFRRDEMVYLSYKALFATAKGSELTLAEKLGKGEVPKVVAPKVVVSANTTFTFKASGDNVTVQVDKATLPDPVKSFSKIVVKHLHTKSLKDVETLVHGDVYFKSFTSAPYGTGYTYENFDGAYIYFLDSNDNVLGFTGYTGKAILSKRELVVSTLGAGAPNVPEIKTGFTLKEDGTASVNIAVLPDYAKVFKRILVKNAYFEGPGMINYEILQNRWSTKNNYENGSINVFKDAFVAKESVRAYLYDANNKCIGYKVFTLEEIIAMMKKVLDKNGVIDIDSGILYHETRGLKAIPLIHELKNFLKDPYYMSIGGIESFYDPIGVVYSNFINPAHNDHLVSYQGFTTNVYPVPKGFQLMLTIFDRNNKLLGYHFIEKEDIVSRPELYKSATVKLAKPMHENDGYFGFHAEYYINGEKQLNYNLGTIDSVIVYNNSIATEVKLFDIFMMPGVGMEVKIIPEKSGVVVESVEFHD